MPDISLETLTAERRAALAREPRDETDLSVGTGGRVAATRELLRLERRIARQEEALRVLRVHRDRLLTLIGQA